MLANANSANLFWHMEEFQFEHTQSFAKQSRFWGNCYQTGIFC